VPPSPQQGEQEQQKAAVAKNAVGAAAAALHSEDRSGSCADDDQGKDAASLAMTTRVPTEAGRCGGVGAAAVAVSDVGASTAEGPVAVALNGVVPAAQAAADAAHPPRRRRRRSQLTSADAADVSLGSGATGRGGKRRSERTIIRLRLSCPVKKEPVDEDAAALDAQGVCSAAGRSTSRTCQRSEPDPEPGRTVGIERSGKKRRRVVANANGQVAGLGQECCSTRRRKRRRRVEVPAGNDKVLREGDAAAAVEVDAARLAGGSARRLATPSPRGASPLPPPPMRSSAPAGEDTIGTRPKASPASKPPRPRSPTPPPSAAAAPLRGRAPCREEQDDDSAQPRPKKRPRPNGAPAPKRRAVVEPDSNEPTSELGGTSGGSKVGVSPAIAAPPAPEPRKRRRRRHEEIEAMLPKRCDAPPRDASLASSQARAPLEANEGVAARSDAVPSAAAASLPADEDRRQRDEKASFAKAPPPADPLQSTAARPKASAKAAATPTEVARVAEVPAPTEVARVAEAPTSTEVARVAEAPTPREVRDPATPAEAAPQISEVQADAAAEAMGPVAPPTSDVVMLLADREGEAPGVGGPSAGLCTVPETAAGEPQATGYDAAGFWGAPPAKSRMELLRRKLLELRSKVKPATLSEAEERSAAGEQEAQELDAKPAAPPADATEEEEEEEATENGEADQENGFGTARRKGLVVLRGANEADLRAKALRAFSLAS